MRLFEALNVVTQQADFKFSKQGSTVMVWIGQLATAF